MNKCLTCPRNDRPDLACLAQSQNVPRYCELCDPSHPDYRPEYIPLILGTVESPAPPVVTRPARDVLIHASLSSWQGYGQLAEAIGRGMEGLGHAVEFVDLGTDLRYLGRDPWVQDRVTPRPGPSPWSILIARPEHPKPPGRVARMTMWETSRLKPNAVAELNPSALVIVPSHQNLHAFLASGVTAPIEVVPMGIDPSFYFDDSTPIPSGKVVFGMAARMAHGAVRKGINEGVRAFVDAFPRWRGDDVELQIKVFLDCLPLIDLPDDPRIKVIAEALDTEGLLAWYRGLTCLFVPSKGEGWGLHTHAAMSVGRPVIAADWGGTSEFWTEACGWGLDFDLAPAGEVFAMAGSEWAVPRHESMVSTLRYVYSHRDEAIAKGRAAALRAAEFTWHRTARELRDVLGRHGFPISTGIPPPVENPEFARLTARRAECPDLGPTLPCGCGTLHICLAGKGRDYGKGNDHTVADLDCFACPWSVATR